MTICKMGNQREYIATGGFSAYLYEDHPGWESKTVNGIHGKVIKLKADKTGSHAGLPTYANTSDMYFRVGKDGKVIQGKVYISRKMCIDFDWSHTHTNKGLGSDGKSFQKGVIHVQTYRVEKDGTTTRLSNNARYMNNSEMNKYGPIIKAFNPDVKFRP